MTIENKFGTGGTLEVKMRLKNVDFDNDKVEDIFYEMLLIFRCSGYRTTRKLLWKHFKKCCDRDRVIMDEL